MSNSRTLLLSTTILGSLLATTAVQAETLNVTVVLANSDTPVVGAQVFAGIDGRGTVYETDANGQVSLSVNDAGTYTVTAVMEVAEEYLFHPLYGSSATTVENTTDVDITIPMGLLAATHGIVAPVESGTTAYEGLGFGYDPGALGKAVVRTPVSYSATDVTGSGSTYAFSVSGSNSGVSPFIAAAQVEVNEDGTYDLEGTPLRFGIVYDAALGTDVNLGEGFAVEQDVSVEGLDGVGVNGEVSNSLCAGFLLVLPEERGSLSYSGDCQYDVSDSSAVVSNMTPDLSGVLESAGIAPFVSLNNTNSSQIVSSSAGPGAVLEFGPIPGIDGWVPKGVSELPGSSFRIDAYGAEEEIMTFSETRTGKFGYGYSSTAWTVINETPDSNLVYPTPPRSVALPHAGSSMPVLFSQNAVVVGVYDATDYLNFNLSYRYLETEVSEGGEERTQAEASKLTPSIPPYMFLQ